MIHSLWRLHLHLLTIVFLWKGYTEWSLPLLPCEDSEIALLRSSVFCYLSTWQEGFCRWCSPWLWTSQHPKPWELQSTLSTHPWYSIIAHSLTRTFGDVEEKISELFPNAVCRDEGMETMKLRLNDVHKNTWNWNSRRIDGSKGNVQCNNEKPGYSELAGIWFLRLAEKYIRNEAKNKRMSNVLLKL